MDFWRSGGGLQTGRGTWARTLLAGIRGGWEPKGCNLWQDDYESRGATCREQNYFCSCVGGNVDADDAAHLADALERFFAGDMTIDQPGEREFHDCERAFVRDVMIAFLRGGSFSLMG